MRKNLILIAAAMLVAACHSSPPANTPPPTPSASEIARQKKVQDSLEYAALASTDSLDRAHKIALLERFHHDSIEASRLEAERARQETADRAKARSATLRDELTTMVYFDVSRSVISTEGQAALDRKVAILGANPEVKLQITGACDERGSESYNMALGEKRAGAVKKYLIGKGIDAARLDQMSTGEGSPASEGHDEASWAQNRRTDFMITSGSQLLAME